MSVVNFEQVPSERDWMLYQVVRVEQWPLREAAKGFELSQTHASQIVQRTADFIARNTTVPSKEEEAQQLAAARQLAADRIDHLHGHAMSSFRSSRDPKNNCNTGRRSYGDARYLHAAARLALIASTLPLPRTAWPGKLDEEPVSQSQREAKAAARSNPAETCSAAPAEQAAEPVAETTAANATAAAMLGCVEKSRDGAAPKTNVARPVQKRPANANKESRRAEFFQTS